MGTNNKSTYQQLLDGLSQSTENYEHNDDYIEAVDLKVAADKGLVSSSFSRNGFFSSADSSVVRDLVGDYRHNDSDGPSFDSSKDTAEFLAFSSLKY